MKTMRLVSRIEKLLKCPPDELPIKKLRKTIKALKQKQEDLEERLKRTRRTGSRRRLQLKINVLKLQRARGAEIYHQLISMHEHGKQTGRRPSNGSIVFLSDQAAAAQRGADQWRLNEQAEYDHPKGDRLDGPPVGQVNG